MLLSEYVCDWFEFILLQSMYLEIMWLLSMETMGFLCHLRNVGNYIDTYLSRQRQKLCSSEVSWRVYIRRELLIFAIFVLYCMIYHLWSIQNLSYFLFDKKNIRFVFISSFPGVLQLYCYNIVLNSLYMYTSIETFLNFSCSVWRILTFQNW